MAHRVSLAGVGLILSIWLYCCMAEGSVWVLQSH